MAVQAPAVALTECSAVDLARAIRSGETSSRDVVEAHIEQLERTHMRINAVVFDRYDAARADADDADAMLRCTADPDTLPPFFGVPCTIKESIAMAGMPNSAGLVSRSAWRATQNAPTVQRMIDAGAIPLGVTNTPELCLWIETENRLYGRTNNAYSARRTAGGSSGGEGAVVGSGGSPLGLGADIAGSIRLPAFFNGVFGLKPTPGLVPSTGQFPVTETEIAAGMLTIGPITRRAEDLMPMLVSVKDLIVAEGSAHVTVRGGLKRKGPHTRALRLLLMSEWLTGKLPQGRLTKSAAARAAFAREVVDTIGDGVLLHPTHPRVAPRHGQTIGKPWLLTTTAVFNLAGVPVAQVPLGLNERGLPLGVQAAVAPGGDHVAVAVALELERAFGGWVPPTPPTGLARA